MEGSEPWDYELLKSDKEFISWFGFNAKYRVFERDIYKRLLNKNKELIKEIEKELQG